MKICLYSPYFPKHIGGGEKYFLDVAFALADYGEVNLAIPQENSESFAVIYDRYEKFLGKSICQFNLIPSPLGTNSSFLKKLFWTSKFDLIYAFTDGSFFPSLAKKNVLHIQTPLKRQPLSIIEKIKLSAWNFINTNSRFTKKIVEKYWQIRVDAVHRPMIDVESIKDLQKTIKKEKVILHVGRFFRQLHSKRQDVLVDFFAELIKKNPTSMAGWKLVLIGSVEDQEYASEVAKKAENLPIEIIHQISRKDLNGWYAKASIYWHATGFDLDEMEHPEKMEHFGISTGEAMAGGAVPVVISSGGQPEVLGEDLTNWLWSSKDDCLAKTLELIDNKDLFKTWSKKATNSIERFDEIHFKKNIEQMMGKIL